METDKEHDEDCVEGEFQLDSVKFDSGERGRETIGMGNCIRFIEYRIAVDRAT